MFLDELHPLEAHVGYGALGVRGDLGYEGKRVAVHGRGFAHALSTHPPARLAYDLGGRFRRFAARVALNDDAPTGATVANFDVLADGRLVATAPHVRAGDPPRELRADVTGAARLELVVHTPRWEYAHAVWLDPRLTPDADGPGAGTLLDALRRAEVRWPDPPLPAADRCVATAVSPGFTGLLDDLLGSLRANGNCPDALVLVFALNPDAECERVAAKYGASLVRCRSVAPVNAQSKAVLYSAGLVCPARAFVCLDADMLVLDDLGPVFAALDALPEGTVLACREANGWSPATLGQAAPIYYGGEPDLRRLGVTPGEAGYPLVVNDGLFAGTRTALLALDAAVRAIPQAPAWCDERADIWWRNQFVFNLALARLGCGVELDGVYNVQLNTQEAELGEAGGRLRARWRGRSARVLHFNGQGRGKYPGWRNRYAAVPDPLPDRGGGDGYAAFLTALRAWAGRRGLAGLAWSFYGTGDATSARVRDPSVFPLFAAVHYLVRSNGCVRVVETGTARGVSAACLASAVAHRPGGRVVTLDPNYFPERDELWAALPPEMGRCIEARAVDSLAGLRAAVDAGETYHAALLDSLHTADHVWEEFRLATRVVCPGGLILIHDAVYDRETVAEALAWIAAAGYGVTRLWAADDGVPEDDRLGLAVVENRKAGV